jgi:hypothetical protein
MSDDEYTPQPGTSGEEDANHDNDYIGHDKAGVDYDRMLTKLDKHLAALKSVREPGRGSLTVREAITTALAQADAYEQWCEFGAPDGVIEVWVEGQMVMALHPGDATDLQGVLFEAAGMPKAVVQVIRRADEVVDTVVLLNRELSDVLNKGGRCEQRHPNNRHVTLEVKQEGKGQFGFWVGFNQLSDAPAPGPGIFERLKGKAAQAGMCIITQAGRLKEAWGLPTFGGAAALVLMLLAGIALTSREQGGTLAAARPPDASAPTLTGEAPHDAPARPVAYEDVKTDAADSLSVRSRRLAAVAFDVVKHAPRAPTVKPHLAPTRIDVFARRDEPVAEGGDAVALTALPERGGAVAAAESSPWDAQRLRRLAEVQRVVLKVDDTTTLDKQQADDLLVSVKGALNELGIVALTDETEKRTADGVILLRFEPDTTLLGAIFATIRDRNGNFLWEDHAGCRVQPDEDGWGATFDDASARLISKLPARAKVASNRGDARSQSVMASKYSRPLARRPVTAQGLVVDASVYERGKMSMNQVVNYVPK